MIRSGELRNRINIERVARVTGALGQQDEIWIKMAEVWASINTISAREAERDDTVQAEATHIVRMRYGAPISPETRIVFNDGQTDRTLNIVGIDQREMKRSELVVRCMEVR